MLLNKIVQFLKTNKEKTKLITKLFSIMPYLLIYKDEKQLEYMNDLHFILDIIYDYIQSDNLEN